MAKKAEIKYAEGSPRPVTADAVEVWPGVWVEGESKQEAPTGVAIPSEEEDKENG